MDTLKCICFCHTSILEMLESLFQQMFYIFNYFQLFSILQMRRQPFPIFQDEDRVNQATSKHTLEILKN